MGRWLWDVGNVRNELIRGETGWSTFEEREAKAMVKLMLRVVFEENLVSEIGRACLIEIGCKSRWWSRCRHIKLLVSGSRWRAIFLINKFIIVFFPKK